MEQTLLIGLDGATFTILDPLMADGTMPFLREFMQSGVRAPLASTANPLTPPAWLTLVTGRTPGQHGVFDFIWAEERQTEHYFTLYNFRDIRRETIWSMVSRQGGSVCSLNFPMMSPPPAVNGCVVPGFVSWKHLRRNVYPAEIYDTLKEVPGFNAKELAWDFDLEKKAEQGVPEEEYVHWVEYHLRRERLWFEITKHLLTRQRPDLTAILFDGPDKILHMGYRFLDPAVFPAAPTRRDIEIRELCRRYFRELDGYLAELVALAGENTRVFMASDHGFGPSWHVFRVNAWLHEKGYLTWKDLDALDEANRAGAERVLDKHFVILDWENTTAYARSSTSNGIFIRVAKEPGQSGVAPEDYERFRARLKEELLTVTDPTTGRAMVKDVLTREEAFPGPYNRQAPDLTLVLYDHGFVSIKNKTPVIYERPHVEGTHYPHGVFLARGPGIRQNHALAPFSIKDVTPCLLYSLGLPIPVDLEGDVPPALFEEAQLVGRPYARGAASAPVVRLDGAPAPTLSPEEEEELLAQLRALGYVE